MKIALKTSLVILLGMGVCVSPVRADPGDPLKGYTSCPWGSDECNPCVQDVAWSIATLRRYGDLAGFHMSGHDVTLGEHWQGVQRLMVGGGRYLVISRSHDDTGAFVLVQLGSRNTQGQRFRSNRFGPADVEDTVPPTVDRITLYEPIDDDYAHAGGIQTLGRWLAVPLEGSHSSAAARIVFYDLAQPTSPVKRYEVDSGWEHAGTASIGKLSDGRYLLVIAGYDANPVKFYVSSATSLSADPQFAFVDEWSKEEADTEIGDTNWGAYQNINVVIQCDGQLFLIGLHNEGWPIAGNKDWIDAWRLEMDANTYDVRLVKVANRHVYCSWGTVDDQCNLDAAAGVYVDPNGRLLAYSTTHNDDGPDSTTSFEEFRNQTWPTSCQGIEDGWSELYDDRDYQDRSLMVDFVDRDLEAYNDFNAVEGFDNKTSSARWCLPLGYRYALYTHHDFSDLLATLDGDGTPQERNVTSDETSSSRYEGLTTSGWHPIIRRTLRDGLGGPLTAAPIPHLLAGTHTVPQGSSLTAEAGATILFMPEARLIAQGTLTIDGTEGTVHLASAEDERMGIRVGSQIVVRNGSGIKLYQGVADR